MSNYEEETQPVATTTADETDTAALAYRLWLERGCPIGSDQEDWFRAEEILKGRKEGKLAASA
ncbi:MAG: DUF2934 domain-containing protein [Bryobacteraceae bacterium]|jgi:hypothetical protein